MNIDKQAAIKELQTLRNIGMLTAEKLYSIGIKTVKQMRQSDPKKLYKKLKEENGGKLDKCVLYQFQGAISDILWWECKELNRR